MSVYMDTHTYIAWLDSSSSCVSVAILAQASASTRNSNEKKDKAQTCPSEKKLQRCLIGIGAPATFIRLVILVATVIDTEPIYDLIEYFAGCKALTFGGREEGLCTTSFEQKDDPVFQDINTPEGFCYAISLALQGKLGSGQHFAPVCSSWGAMNRGTSKR